MRFKAFSLWLALALVFCLVGVAFTPIPALAAENIDLNPTRGDVDDDIDVDGSDFDADDEIDIYFAEAYGENLADLDDDDENYEKVDSVTVRSTGRFDASFDVPSRLNDGDSPSHTVRSGRYYVLAVDTSDEILVHASFRVEDGDGEGEIELDPTRGYVGERVKVEADDFEEDETFYLYFTDSYLEEGDDWDIDDIAHCEYLGKENTDVDEDDFTSRFNVPDETTDGDDDPEDVTAGRYYVVVVDSKSTGDVLAVDMFDVILPDITLIPTHGEVGGEVRVSGIDFIPRTTVTIDYDGEFQGIETTDSNGGFTFNLTIPPSPAGPHVVEARDKSNEAKATFEVEAHLDVEPTQVNVGTKVKVTGSGFSHSQTLTIKYGETTVVSGVTTKSDGSFIQSFTAPARKHGGVTIAASDASGITAQTIITMESTPPSAPTPTLPLDGSRIGFVGKVSPTFEWETVTTDPSGISHYVLEVASNETFATDCILFPFPQNLTEDDLTIDPETNTVSYTLPEDNALPQGTYYWHVMAVDRADNESDPSLAFSFKSGLLPLWLFIVIVALIAVLIGFLVYFFAMRKKALYY